MSRWKAASIHLSISVVVGFLVVALLFLVWYPQPYFDASGGQQLIIILLGVDLVLGPLLTLVLFKSGKKGMLFDLCMIGIVQASALIYGLHAIALARPAFIVAAVDRFNVVAANDLDPSDLAKGTQPEYRSVSWTGPRLVAAHLPTDPEKSAAVMTSGLAGKDIERLPEHYVPYEMEAQTLLARAKPVELLRKTSPDAGVVLDAWLKDHQAKEENVVWLPIMARRTSLTMILDAKSGELLGTLPIDPW